MSSELQQVRAVLEIAAPLAPYFTAPADELFRTPRAEVLRRFLAKLDVDPSGCWRWRGATAGGNRSWDRGGPYGQMKIDKKNVYVHRLSLILSGRPCPGPEYVPHHWCRVRLCARPGYPHLEWLTAEENTRLSNECSGEIPF